MVRGYSLTTIRSVGFHCLKEFMKNITATVIQKRVYQTKSGCELVLSLFQILFVKVEIQMQEIEEHQRKVKYLLCN